MLPTTLEKPQTQKSCINYLNQNATFQKNPTLLVLCICILILVVTHRLKSKHTWMHTLAHTFAHTRTHLYTQTNTHSRDKWCSTYPWQREETGSLSASSAEHLQQYIHFMLLLQQRKHWLARNHNCISMDMICFCLPAMSRTSHLSAASLYHDRQNGRRNLKTTYSFHWGHNNWMYHVLVYNYGS